MGRKGTSVNKARNMARIVHRLVTNPRGWPVEDLIEQLGIAERTYRDYRLDLQENFEPFFDDTGTSRVVEVNIGSRRVLTLRAMDESQDSRGVRERLMGMYLARRMFDVFDGTPLLDEITSVLSEIGSGLRDHSLRHSWTADLERKLYAHPSAPVDYAKKGAVLSALMRALMHERLVKITYNSGSWDNPPMTLTLEPLTLAMIKDSLYLMALNPPHDDVRTYTILRIESVEVLRDHFAYPDHAAYHPERLFDGYFGAFSEPASRLVHVELIFRDMHWLKLYLQERTWHKTQLFDTLDDGRLKMTFTVHSMDSVWPWIRSFGEDVEVIQPTKPVDAEPSR